MTKRIATIMAIAVFVIAAYALALEINVYPVREEGVRIISTPNNTATGSLGHDTLVGLGDDDHPQYLFTDGTRDLTGDWVVSANDVTLTAGAFQSEVLTVDANSVFGANDVNTVGISTTGMITFAGVDSGIQIPHLMQSDSTTQSIANVAAAQVVTFNTDVHATDITRTSSSRFTVTKAGTYEVIISAIADTTAASKHLEIWLRVNGADVANSNTRTHMAANVEIVVAVSYLVDFANDDDYFEFWTWGDATSCRWLATAAGAAPTRPAVPSIIMTCKYVSGDQ